MRILSLINIENVDRQNIVSLINDIYIESGLNRFTKPIVNEEIQSNLLTSLSGNLFEGLVKVQTDFNKLEFQFNFTLKGIYRLANSPKEASELLSTLYEFFQIASKVKNVNVKYYELENLYITNLLHLQLKDQYEKTIWNLEQNEIYIPELNYVVINFATRKDGEREPECRIGSEGIMISGSRDRCIESVKNNELYTSVERLLVSFLFSAVNNQESLNMFFVENLLDNAINTDYVSEEFAVLINTQLEKTFKNKPSDVIMTSGIIEYESVTRGSFDFLKYAKYYDTYFYFSVTANKMFFSRNEKELVKRIDKDIELLREKRKHKQRRF